MNKYNALKVAQFHVVANASGDRPKSCIMLITEPNGDARAKKEAPPKRGSLLATSVVIYF
jgi:hypothetical protein